MELTGIVPLIPKSLGVPDTQTLSNDAQVTLCCLHLSIHLSEFGPRVFQKWWLGGLKVSEEGLTRTP